MVYVLIKAYNSHLCSSHLLTLSEPSRLRRYAFHLSKGNLEKASTLDCNVCDIVFRVQSCVLVVDPISEKEDPHNMAKIMKYFACSSCREDSEIQEKWRYNEKNKQLMILDLLMLKNYIFQMKLLNVKS